MSEPPKCHVYRDLQKLFPKEYNDEFIDRPVVKINKEPDYLVYSSFLINALLMVCKIIAIFFSSSMAVLTSMMDTTLDVISGVVLLMAVKYAKKGITRGKYQYTLKQEIIQYKFINAMRFENLGVLVFSVIMGTISMVLIGESIISITEMIGSDEPVELNAFIITIMAVNIVSKFILTIWCAKAAKRTEEGAETLVTLSHDHRNDCMSNAIGLLSVCLAFYAGGDWRFCDPVGAIILSLYIFWNWGSHALEMIKAFAGTTELPQARKDEHLMRLLHQFGHTFEIQAVNTFLVYASGENEIIEMRIQLPQKYEFDQI